jgi:cytohesin
LAELPDTLDETYERTLREINKAGSELAHRLFQCVAVACRPLRVEELAEFLAFDFNVGTIPKLREIWRLEDPVEAVLSTCSTLLSLVNVGESQVIQFSHFSVKEFLTSFRFAEKNDAISRRYHISMTPAHTLVAQACLGMLLHLDESITNDGLKKFPLAEYAAEHWVEHAHFEGVSENAETGMKQLFEPTKPHLAVWVWIHEPGWGWRDYRSTERPLALDRTPLHYAASCGLHAIVKFLVIERLQNVHARDPRDQSTPLHMVSPMGHMDLARFLLEQGADMSAKDNYGRTPLHRALARGHMDLARFLVEQGADVSAKDEDGSTPLHSASERGHVDVVRILVGQGADVSAKNEYGSTPLHRASEWGHVDVVRFLVGQGAEVSAKVEYGSTPLHLASERGHVDVVRILVGQGADVSAKDEHGSTPLHSASERGHVDAVRILVGLGADVSAKDEHGSTPLHRASDQGHVDDVRILIGLGADVSARNEHGSTPLHRASDQGHADVVQFLVGQCAEVSAKDEHGSTPLHRAVGWRNQDPRLVWFLPQASKAGYPDLARFLVEHGANVSAKDEYGWTPLHWALGGGHVDLAQFLFEHRGNVSAKN